MNAAEAITEARRKTDDWVVTKPPAFGYRREYAFPGDPNQFPNQVRTLLDQAFPPWRAGQAAAFEVATHQDARRLDAALFDERRQALLEAADKLLDGVIRQGLPAPLVFPALTALAYTRAQLLLWLDQLDVAMPKPAWQTVGESAQRAWQAMNAHRLTEADWVDAVLRLETAWAWAYLAAGTIDQALQHFLYVIGWYASAAQLGYRQITRARYEDWLGALYAIADFGRDQADQVWMMTATLLLKDLQIGHYRVKPPFVASRPPGSRPGTGLTVQFNASLAGMEWRQAAARLGDQSAFIDLAVTNRNLHVWLRRRQTTRHITQDLDALRARDPNAAWLTPLGTVFDPSVSGLDRQLADLADEWHPEMARVEHSEQLRWISYFQNVHVHWAHGWTWDLRWKSTFPSFSGDLWRSVYDMVYGEAASVCRQAGIRHLIISPDGALAGLPHHLLRGPDGSRLGDQFAISYAPNLTGMLTVLDTDQLDPAHTRFVIVQDPTQTVGLAQWECASVARLAGRAARMLEGAAVTAAALKQACQGAGVLHFTGHAQFSWLQPEQAFLTVGGGQRMGLAELRALRLQPGALVYLSACHTGRTGAGTGRATAQGIASALLEAGAATVICTLWPVHSVAAALVATWFYEAWLSGHQGRLESLQQALSKLRVVRRLECEALLQQRIYLRGERPFEDEYYWGAFALFGAW